MTNGYSAAGPALHSRWIGATLVAGAARLRRWAKMGPVMAAMMVVAALVTPWQAAQAQVQIDITQGVTEPLPIAITNFVGDDGSESGIGRDIASVVAANLQRSGVFRPISPGSFIQSPQDIQSGPNYSEWSIINAQALVGGRVRTESDGRYRVEFRLWDVVNESQMVGLAYSTAPDNWRRVAHIISDAIYSEITGEDGYFDTQIVYVSESGPGDNRTKRLAIMDQDGENHRFLTDGGSLVLTPRFSPSAREITYLSYQNNRPRVFLFNIDSGRQESLGEFQGMTFSPRFSPDGNRVVMSQAVQGNSDIYMMDLRTRDMRRMTDAPGIDTSPSFSPDGARLAFESDRGGSQQIYTMNADGSNARRITYGDGRYGGPVWSPRGDLIAFTKIEGGRFHIGVIRPDGTGERILAEGYHVEGPTWAPNGRVLMYFTESPGSSGARSALRAVDISGTHSWNVPTPQDASDPAWSPLIP